MRRAPVLSAPWTGPVRAGRVSVRDQKHQALAMLSYAVAMPVQGTLIASYQTALNSAIFAWAKEGIASKGAH